MIAMKISVIIPVYNTSAYLPRCLKSVQGQTYRDLEIILVDDGSTDGSSELCDEYARSDARIKVVHRENGGAAAAKNTGLDAATGDCIGFVDSDDWIEADMYEYLLSLLAKHDADIAEIMLDVAHSEIHKINQPAEQIRCYEGSETLIHFFEHNEYALGLRLYKARIFADFRLDDGRINEDVVGGFLAYRAAKKLVVSNLKKYHYFSNAVGVSESPLRRRDFDLLYAGERLDDLTAKDTDEAVRKLALTKKYRASFTLLIKMALFGCSEELDKKATKRELQEATKKHYRFLLASGMPTNRKLLLTVACYCYPLLAVMGLAYRAVRGL